MLLNVTVCDNRNVRRGSVRLQLDFAAQQWSIPAGQQQGWAGVGFSNPAKGSFEVKDNKVIWLWDQRPGEHNTVIIRDAPNSETDSKHLSGQGRIFDPKDPSFKDGRISWTVDPSSIRALAPVRQRVLDLVQGIPFSFPPVYKVNFPNGPPTSKPSAVKGKVTNCGEFPGWITKNIGGSDAPKDLSLKFQDQWGWYALTAPMTGWETWAKKLQAQRGSKTEPIWIPYSKNERPQPGDIYVLYGWTDLVIDGKINKVYGFAHVGIIIDATDSTWITADCGQGEGAGRGFSGCYQKRIFSEGKLTLQSYTVDSGKPQPDAGTKDIKGWVNLENLFKGWKPS